MSKKISQSKQKKEEQRRLEEKKQQQQKKIVKYSIIAGAAVIAIVAAIILIVNLTAQPNYVRMTVSYTDDNGQSHTGDIIIELEPDIAPITVKNFKKLVSEGFYDGLTFHRVIEGFMIQGGDPEGTGQGGSPNKIKGEFSKNGVNNTIRHKRGVISMARQGASTDAQDAYYYNTASSQFFIVHETSPHLDGKYAAFGRVVSGMELVDGIATMSTNASDKPLQEAKIVSATLIKKP